MEARNKTARKLRAVRSLSALNNLKQSLTQLPHFSILLRRMLGLTHAAALVILGNTCMAVQNSGNLSAQPPTGQLGQHVYISSADPQLTAPEPLRVQQSVPDTVNNSIPLGTPSDPEVAAKPGPKANQAGDKTHDASIRVNPDREFSWLHWLSFWGLCLFLGFALSQIIVPRQK